MAFSMIAPPAPAAGGRKEKMVLYQMLHQSKTDSDKVEFVSQAECATWKDWEKWSEHVTKEFPPPKGYQWLCCNEKSPHFMVTTGVYHASGCSKCEAEKQLTAE